MLRAVATTVLLGLAFASPVAAQSPDFLFGRPTKSVAVRAAWLVPRESGDVFDFLHNQLTIDPGDFKAAAIAAEFGVAVTPRVTLLLGAEGSRATVTSEYRKYLGSDGLPINQQSQLTNVGVNASVKFALTNTGRRISRYAWIPGALTPYIGGGAGAVHYLFEQEGEFVDANDLSIFPDKFSTRGWGPSAHVFGGMDVHVWQNLYLNVDARYVWAHAGVGTDFVGFKRFDLSGFRLSSGVSFVF